MKIISILGTILALAFFAAASYQLYDILKTVFKFIKTKVKGA